jgi:hypothetical protein
VKRKTVVVNDKMQRGYRYELVAPPGAILILSFVPS